MKIVIPGGSGQVGRLVARELGGEHEVVIVSRSPILRWAWDRSALCTETLSAGSVVSVPSMMNSPSSSRTSVTLMVIRHGEALRIAVSRACSDASSL